MKKINPNKSTEHSYDRIPPQALEIEDTVLGAMLIDPETVYPAFDKLTVNCFHRSANKLIFNAMKELFEANQHIDVITVPEKLRQTEKLDDAGGAYFISQLVGMVSSTAGIENYIKILQEKASLRNIIINSTELTNYAYLPEATLENCLVKVDNLTKEESTQKASILPMLEVLGKTSDAVIARSVANSQGKTYGLKTGFHNFDYLTGGLKRKKFIVLAARPSMGKTAFALKVAYNAAKTGHPIGIISLEMGADELVERMVSFTGTIPADKIRDGLLTETEMQHFNRIAGKIAELPIYFTDEFNLTVHRIAAKASLMKSKFDIQLLIIDYLQLIQWSYGQSNENQALTEINRTLKLLAGTLDIPIILLSQLNREVTKRAKPQPRMSDLRGSGSIEQDADMIVFLWRNYIAERDNDPEVVDDGTADFFLAKQRNGRIGGFQLGFLADYVNFINPEDKNIYEQEQSITNAAAIARHDPGEKDIPF